MSEQTAEVSLLKKIPIFEGLSDDELKNVRDAPENGIEEYGPKELIVREMEVGDCMYIVLDGAVEVSLRGGDPSGREVTIATLRPGDFFGEQSLSLDNSKTGRRNASVRSLNMAKLFKIDKQYVRLALSRDKGDEDRTMALDSSMSREEQEIKTVLQEMRLFQSLTEAELNMVGSWAQVEKVGPGDFVVKESEKGDCMYVILDGTVEIFTLDDSGKISILAALERGDYFGEQALMPGSSGERNAYARTDEVARLIRIPKAYFRLVLNRDKIVAQALQKIGDSQQKKIDQIQKS